MNVLSLFDGMSCGQIALERAGIKVESYFASEIDKFAIQVCMSNYKNTIQIGDVCKVKGSDLPKIDLLIGGSPCQGFSFAGKGLNFEDERSKLFFEFVRIYRECLEINPDLKFLLENVKMKKEHQLVISNYLGIQPIEINSALVSAQNRVRLYWTNIAIKPYGLFGDMISGISQPEDRGIFLKDILEEEVDEKYYLSEAAMARINRSSYSRAKVNPDKTGTLNTKNNSGQLSHDSGTTLICGSLVGRHIVDGKRKDIKGAPTEQRFEANNTGKTNCLTSVQKDNLIKSINPTLEGKQTQQQDRVYDTSGKMTSICSDLGGRYNINTARYRRLTEIECERLQGVPDNYTACVSSTQRYQMLGNGWNIDTIVHILNYNQ